MRTYTSGACDWHPDASAGDLRQMLIRMSIDFQDKAPLSAAEAATVILDGVRSGLAPS
jgi:hypothetical protein